MADLYCTGCNYCMPCPQQGGHPRRLRAYNLGRVYGLWEHARSELRGADAARASAADACIECGECEAKCPQHLAIRKQLEEAHAALTAK